MSKIARIYQGINEIQKYYQGGVLQRLFFDWKHYIGNELNIEYAKECAGRNVVISGKTYQNLFKAELSQGHADSALISKKTTRVNSEGFNLPVKNFTISVPKEFEVLIYTNYVNNASGFSPWKNKIVWSNSSETNNIRIMIRKPDESNITVDEVIGKVILLEGDYTNTDLPDNINGIESVGEGEIEDNNLISEMIVGWCNIATGKVEGCPESWPNSKVSNLIEINPNIKYKSNILSRAIGETTGPDNLRIRCFDENKNYVRFTTEEAQWLCDFNDFYNHKDIYKSIKYIRILVLDSFLEVEEPYVVKGNINRLTYPVTIRNYNYQCETDGVTLSNGVKNSIDTIDGKKVHAQRVGKIVLDATNANNFKQVNTMQVFRWDYFFNTTSFVSGICDKFPIKNVVTLADENKGIRLSGNNFKCLDIKFPDDTGFNINTFRTWLSENPVTVWYELATPIYTYLESGIYDDITIPTSGIKNEIYSENGKWYHKRNIGKVIFDGSSDEIWNYYNKDSIQRFDIKMPNEAKMYNVRTPVYAVGYRFEASKNEDKIIFISGVETVNKLYIYNYAYTSIEDFRAYLTENPLEVYYELTEPVITELYYNNITYKLDEPLRSLPNGVCDTIEEGKIVRRVGILTVDENTKIERATNLDTSQTERYRIWINDIKVNSEAKLPLLCDAFITDIAPSDNYTVAYIHNNTKAIHIKKLITDTTFNNVDELRALLFGHSFYYELETPTEIPITPDMILINGETITDTIGTELPNEVKDSIEEGYYIKRVGKVVLDGSDDEKWEIERTTNNNNLMNAGILIESVWNKSRNDIESGKIDYYFFSDKLPNQCTGIASTTTEGIMFHMRHMYVRILLSKLSSQDIDGLRNYLSKNPITVWYELATTVKIPLFSIKEGLTTLKSTNNITPQMELDCLVRDDFQNMCDNEWESGDINLGGVNYDNINRIRLVNYIELKPNTIYRLDIINSVPILNSGLIGTRFYDSSKKYLGNDLAGNIKSPTYTFITPADCYYIRFIAETRDTNFKIYLKEVIE